MAIDLLIEIALLSKRIHFFAFVLVIFSVSANSAGLSDKALSLLATKKDFRLCIDSGNMPMSGIDGAGEFVGVIADFSKLIAEKAEKHILFVSIDAQEGLSELLKKDECDAFSSSIQPKKHHKHFRASQSYFQEPVAIVISNEHGAIEDEKHLIDKRIAIKKNTSLFNNLQDKYPALHFIPVHNAKIGMAMVSAEHVYGYIDSLTILAFQAKNNGVTGLKMTKFLDNTVQNFLLTRRDQTVLLDTLNKAILSISEIEKNNIVSLWAGINYQKKLVNNSLTLWLVSLMLTILAISVYIVASVKKQKESLQRTYKSLSEEKDQLRAKLDQKVDAEKQSIRFAEMFSHEYRTPVSIISTNLDILELKNKQKPLFIDSQLEKMRDAVAKLIVLVETALDRESLASSNLIEEKSEMDLLMLIRALKEEMLVNYPKRNLVLQTAEKSCLLLADKKLLKIMLKNLIENAFKYSHINQAVSIGLYTENKKIIVTITDQGIGIPYADIKHIFDKYHRASNTSNTTGIGLGLYLSKLIVTQHKGNISVTCPPEGGTQITIVLPQ